MTTKLPLKRKSYQFKCRQLKLSRRRHGHALDADCKHVNIKLRLYFFSKRKNTVLKCKSFPHLAPQLHCLSSIYLEKLPEPLIIQGLRNWEGGIGGAIALPPQF